MIIKDYNMDGYIVYQTLDSGSAINTLNAFIINTLPSLVRKYRLSDYDRCEIESELLLKHDVAFNTFCNTYMANPVINNDVENIHIYKMLTEAIPAYLTKTYSNYVVDYVRAIRRERKLQRRYWEQKATEDRRAIRMQHINVEQVMDELLESYFDLLTPQEAQVIRYSYFAQLPPDRIAEAMNITDSNVHTIKNRAKAKMLEMIYNCK